MRNVHKATSQLKKAQTRAKATKIEAQICPTPITPEGKNALRESGYLKTQGRKDVQNLGHTPFKVGAGTNRTEKYSVAREIITKVREVRLMLS